MSDHFDELRENVLNYVEAHRRHKQENRTVSHAKLMGHLLTVHLEQQRRTRRDFAEALGVKRDIADLILRGDLPSWMINDEALVRIAEAAEIDANVLRVTMKRKVDQSRSAAEF